MQELLIHFYKSILIANKLGYKFLKEFNEIYNLSNIKKDKEIFSLFKEYSIKRIQNNIKKELIEEIIMIEYEKVILKDNFKVINEISACEKRFNIHREEILSFYKEKELKEKFRISPFIKYYESFWEWFETDEANFFTILDNINCPKGNYFFLFKKIGIYDEISQSNILEFPLNKFNYFLLRIFEEPMTIYDATKKFMKGFDFDSEIEFLELKKQTSLMLKIMIFNKFIILNDTQL